MPNIQTWNDRIDQLDQIYQHKLLLLWQIEQAKEQLEHDAMLIEKEVLYLKQAHPYLAMMRAQHKQQQDEQKFLPIPEPETGPFQWRPDMIKRPVTSEVK